MKLLCIFALTAASALSQDWSGVEKQVKAETRHQHRWNVAWGLSICSMLAATSVDGYSSYGMREINPILANRQGQFAMRGELLKGCFAGVVIATEGLLGKRYRKLSTLSNFAMSAGYGAAAWHNERIK